MNALISHFVRKGVFANMMTIFLIVVGLSSLFTIRKEAFPNISYDIITVNTIFPGASAEEVERLVTNILERELRELDGIRDINSISRQNQSFIVIELDPDETTGQEARQDVQNIVDRISNLPDDAETPIVTELDSRIQPIITLSVAGDVDEMTLRDKARKLEREIEFLPGVARVSPQGLRELEAHIEVDLEKIYRYRVSLEEIADALARQNVSIPGGTLDTSGEAYLKNEKIIRTVGEFENIEDIKNTVVRSNELGEPIFVKDVADVFYSLERAREIFRTDGRNSINLTIMKNEMADALSMVASIRDYISQVEKNIELPIYLEFIDDSSEFIQRRLGVLSNNLLVGLVLIVIILSFILPWKVALVAAVCIPISFLGTLVFFDVNSISLNLLSMLGLIIVAGMLVDGAIVVTDNTVRKMEEGMDAEQAAIEGTQQVWAPIAASLLTTITAFLPMMFMSGIFGKFVFHIPVGVIVALLLSMVVCFFILPYQLQRWGSQSVKSYQKKKKSQYSFDQIWHNKVVPLYLYLLDLVLKFRYVVAGFGIFLFVGTLFFAKNSMRFVLFPPGMVELFVVKTEAPVGTSLEKHLKLLAPIEEKIKNMSDHELRNFTTHIGQIQSNPNDPQSRRGAQYAQIRVFLTPSTQREREAIEIIEEFRAELSNLPGLESVSFDQVSGGPPVGAAVSIGVTGQDYDVMMLAVKRIENLLSEIDGVIDIGNNFSAGKEELKILVNSAEAQAAGVNVAQVGTSVRGAFEGLVPTALRTFDEEVDIRVMPAKRYRQNPDSLEKILVPNSRGDLVPLSRIARIEKSVGIEQYEHHNFRREIRVTADVLTDRVTSQEVSRIMREKSAEILDGLDGVGLNFTGEARDTEESLDSLFRAFIVAVMGIFFILILLFGQLMQPFIVLLTVPIGIIASIWTFYFHGLPLSFMGMLGIVALGGVIVNNAIVFVDFVNQSRAQGMDRFESILSAGKVRIRPLFLTTVTTVCGLFPTAYGIGGLDLFIVPIALILAWGILIGSFLISFFIPAALAIVDDLVIIPLKVRPNFLPRI